MYTGKDVDAAFDTGYACGQSDEEKRSRHRDDLLHRLAAASEAMSNGDRGPMDEMAREYGLRDDLLDVADAAGVTPLADVDPGELVDGLEQWLRDGGR